MIRIRTFILLVAVSILVVWTNDLLACSYIARGSGWTKDELILKSRVIALVKIRDQEEMHHGTRYYFEPIEAVKGADFFSPSFLEFASDTGKHNSNNFNGHEATEFWESETGRYTKEFSCNPNFSFEKGESYLFFPDATGAAMSAEIIASKEDKWYQYVKDKVMDLQKVDKKAFGYTRIDFPEAAGTLSKDINNAGLVVGYYMRPDATQHGFLWDGSKYQSIDFPDAISTFAEAINMEGMVVGSYHDQNVKAHGFLWDGNEYQTIDYPGALYTLAHGINDAGTVVGQYLDSKNDMYGFLWNGNEYTQIAVPDADDTFAFDINNEGVVAGYYIDDKYDSGQHGFLWNGSEYKTIDHPDGYDTQTYGITNSGDVVGSYISTADGQYHGFSWNGKQYTTIDFPDVTNSKIYGGNDSGAVVGVNRSLSAGFLYQVK